jgi:O-antigen ligase
LFHLIPRVDSVIQASQTRFDIWKGSFTIWQEHSLFGVTPLGFGQEYLKHYNEFVPHAHNILIGMFAEYGTLGGLAFLLLVSLNLVKCVHLFFSIRRKKYFLDSFLLGLPIILLTGVFDEPLFSPQIGFLTVVFLACWDQYSKRILFVIKLPSISRINEWIYTQILEPKDQP